MTMAPHNIPSPRAVVSILSDCETHTDLISGAAGLISHLQTTELDIQERDLEPIRFILERSADALENLHKEAQAAIKGTADEPPPVTTNTVNSPLAEIEQPLDRLSSLIGIISHLAVSPNQMYGDELEPLHSALDDCRRELREKWEGAMDVAGIKPGYSKTS